MKNKATPHTLVVYAQQQEHDDAFLVGNNAALGRLRDAIDAALVSGDGEADFFQPDGEGYTLHVVITEDAWSARPPTIWQRLVESYADYPGRDRGDDFRNLSPHALVAERRRK